jgi:hypothetical protein
MDNASTDTVVQDDNIAPVTDTANPVDNVEESTNTVVKSENTTPAVEIKDGKTFVNGVRMYSRDDTNRIAANAKNEVEKNILNDLNVDSIDSVKQVVSTLQQVSPEEGQGLNVESLRSAVQKREATVEELKGQVNNLKTELLLKDHMGKLTSAMPSNWNADQRNAVIDLMKARNMLAVEGDTFAIRNGEDFLTTDGETPDYGAAVDTVGKTLGLSFGKKGVDLQYSDTATHDVGSKGLDDTKVSSDIEYRNAYMNIRKYQPSLKRGDITDAMVKSQLKKMKG